MRWVKSVSVVVGSQLLLAAIMANDWYRTGSGTTLFIAVLSAFLAVVCAIAGYAGRNNPPPPKADPQALRKLAWLGCATGVLALAALLWRVQGDWRLLGEQVNLWLALVCIVGLGYGLSAALALTLRRKT